MDAALGQKMGPGFSESALMEALDRLLSVYMKLRRANTETFSQAVTRLGVEPFRSALYEVSHAA